MAAETDRNIATETDAQHPALDHADAVVAIHRMHEKSISRHQKIVEKVTYWLGRPFLVYTVVSLSAAWIAYGLLAPRQGWPFWDSAPFPILQALWSFAALIVAAVVLITQNRQAKIDQRQVQLDIQLSLLVDQKTAKIIELIEELRRDLPNIENRVDVEAELLKTTVSAEELAEDLERRFVESEGTEELDANQPGLEVPTRNP